MSDNRYKIQYDREKTALKFYLIGKGYSIALRALGFAEQYHNGLRKDGKTPEFHHQVRIALSITQLKDITNEETKLVLALTHDTQEDYAIPRAVMTEKFGIVISDKNWKLTKKFEDYIKIKEEYIREISEDEDTSIDKGVDRNDNLDRMIGVFDIPKMASYAEEAKTVFLPMLKKASKLFPEQISAYNSISQEMKSKISFIEAYVHKCKELEMSNQILAYEKASRERAVVNSKIDVKSGKETVESLKSALVYKENQLNQIQREFRAATFTGTIEEIRALKQKADEIASKRRVYTDAVAVIEKTFPHSQGLTGLEPSVRRALYRELAIKFGVSELELTEFNNDAVSGPIPSN